MGLEKRTRYIFTDEGGRKRFFDAEDAVGRWRYITDELFRERAADAETAARIQSLSGELRRWLPPAKRGEPGVR